MRQRVCWQPEDSRQPTCCPCDGQTVLDSLSHIEVVILDQTEPCLGGEGRSMVVRLRTGKEA